MKLKYKSYKCDIRYDADEDMYVGTVKGYPEYVVSGYDKSEAESEFRYIVDEYLEVE